MKENLLIMSTLNTNLESFLERGEIHIASYGDHYLRTSFFPHGFKEVDQIKPVESHRGIRHLLLLLEVDLDKEKEKELIEKGDQLYPHNLYVIGSSPLDQELENLSAVRICRENGKVVAYGIKRRLPPLGIPALYGVRGIGETIVGALENLSIQTPKKLPYPDFSLLQEQIC